MAKTVVTWKYQRYNFREDKNVKSFLPDDYNNESI